MTSLYLCRDGETVEGPLSADKVRWLIESGALPADAQITPEGEEDWRDAHAYFGLRAPRSGEAEELPEKQAGPRAVRQSRDVKRASSSPSASLGSTDVAPRPRDLMLGAACIVLALGALLCVFRAVRPGANVALFIVGAVISGAAALVWLRERNSLPSKQSDLDRASRIYHKEVRAYQHRFGHRWDARQGVKHRFKAADCAEDEASPVHSTAGVGSLMQGDVRRGLFEIGVGLAIDKAFDVGAKAVGFVKRKLEESAKAKDGPKSEAQLQQESHLGRLASAVDNATDELQSALGAQQGAIVVLLLGLGVCGVAFFLH